MGGDIQERASLAGAQVQAFNQTILSAFLGRDADKIGSYGTQLYNEWFVVFKDCTVGKSTFVADTNNYLFNTDRRESFEGRTALLMWRGALIAAYCIKTQALWMQYNFEMIDVSQPLNLLVGSLFDVVDGHERGVVVFDTIKSTQGHYIKVCDILLGPDSVPPMFKGNVSANKTRVSLSKTTLALYGVDGNSKTNTLRLEPPLRAVGKVIKPTDYIDGGEVGLW